MYTSGTIENEWRVAVWVASDVIEKKSGIAGRGIDLHLTSGSMVNDKVAACRDVIRMSQDGERESKPNCRSCRS